MSKTGTIQFSPALTMDKVWNYKTNLTLLLETRELHLLTPSWDPGHRKEDRHTQGIIHLLLCIPYAVRKKQFLCWDWYNKLVLSCCFRSTLFVLWKLALQPQTWAFFKNYFYFFINAASHGTEAFRTLSLFPHNIYLLLSDW